MEMGESLKDRIRVSPDVLGKLLIGELPCALSMDDEAYLYSEKMQWSRNIAQSFMILKALENGVAEKQFANALSLNVLDLRRRRDLLDEICREAVFLLRNGNVAMGVFTVWRKMKPARQVEAAEHMIAAITDSIAFAKALLSVTSAELLVSPIQKSKISAKYMASHERLGRETERLVKDPKRNQRVIRQRCSRANHLFHTRQKDARESARGASSGTKPFRAASSYQGSYCKLEIEFKPFVQD
jgi:hypothetical protein